MTTKNITIKKYAYDMLRREKSADESFSDVIIKLASRRGRLLDSAGKWNISDVTMKRVQRELSASWRRFGGRKMS